MSNLDPIVTDGPGASAVNDHPFTPRDAWWTTCGFEYGRRFGEPARLRRCGLAEAAHATSTLSPAPLPEFPTGAAQEPMGEHRNGNGAA